MGMTHTVLVYLMFNKETSITQELTDQCLQRPTGYAIYVHASHTVTFLINSLNQGPV